MADPTLEQILLREHPWCEFPDENGKPICMRPAAHILTLPSQYTVAVCHECAAYIAKERAMMLSMSESFAENQKGENEK